MRTALIAGAGGLVGAALLEELLAAPAYGRVVALVRQPLLVTHPKLEQQVVDFGRLAEGEPARPADDVYCCLGTTIRKAGSQAAFRRVDHDYPLALARLAQRQGARQYLIVTSMGADPHSRIFYSRVKGEVEAALRAMGLPGLHVFRPSLLLGQRRERRPGEALAAALSTVVAPLLAGPLRRYRPIPGAAVARAMLRVALQGAAGAHVYESDRIADLAARV